MKKLLVFQLVIFVFVCFSYPLTSPRNAALYEHIFPFNWTLRLAPTLQEDEALQMVKIIQDINAEKEKVLDYKSFFCYKDKDREYSKCRFSMNNRRISYLYRDINQCEYGYYEITYNPTNNHALCIAVENLDKRWDVKPKTFYYAPWGAKVIKK